MYSKMIVSFPASIDLLRSRYSLQDTPSTSTSEILLVSKKQINLPSCDVGTQTDTRSFTLALKQGVSKAVVLH